MRSERQVVDYALQRRALLAQVHAGRVGPDEVRDASPYLVRAARFHGQPTERLCPLCRREPLTLVSWVFGDGLRHASGSARRPEELETLATLHREFSVYVVEVCSNCHWNHLVVSYVLGTGDAPADVAGRRGTSNRRPRTGRTAAE